MLLRGLDLFGGASMWGKVTPGWSLVEPPQEGMVNGARQMLIPTESMRGLSELSVGDVGPRRSTCSGSRDVYVPRLSRPRQLGPAPGY